MKRSALLLLALLGSLSSVAKCRFGFFVWPTSATVPPRAVFVLEASGLGNQVLAELSEKHPAYLVARGRKILLRVRERCVGQLRSSQVVLVPTEPLAVGQTYQLAFGSPLTYIGPQSFGATRRRRKAGGWRVVASAPDTLAWRQRPAVTGKEDVRYGCGPARQIQLAFAVAGNADHTLFRATVRKVGTDSATVYYLHPHQGMLAVGRGMCGGAFDLATDTRYEVSFDLLDRQGQVLAWQGDPIPFTTHWTSAVSRGGPPRE